MLAYYNGPNFTCVDDVRCSKMEESATFWFFIVCCWAAFFFLCLWAWYRNKRARKDKCEPIPKQELAVTPTTVIPDHTGDVY